MFQAIFRFTGSAAGNFSGDRILTFDLVHDISTPEGTRLAQECPSGKLLLEISGAGADDIRFVSGVRYYLELVQAPSISPAPDGTETKG